MKYKSQTLVVAISLMIIVMSLGQHQVSADFMWSDDFNDGNYDGWTVVNGTWSASSNALIATGGVGQHTLSNIYYPSNVNYGNFSFDFFQDESVTGTFTGYVYVHGYDIQETGILNAIPFFGISLNIGPVVLNLVRIWNNMGTTLESYTHPEAFDGWYHIDMLVMSNHSIHVYLEKELVMTALSLTVFEPSECFFVFMPNNGGIDNVIVDAEDMTTTSTSTGETSTSTGETSTTTSNTSTSTTDTTTASETTTTEDTTITTTSQTEPPPIDMTIPLMIAGGGVLVVIVIIVVLKRR